MTQRDILGDDSPGTEVDPASSPGIERLIHHETGLLGDIEHYDLFYGGSMWCFAEAVERGLDCRSPLLNRTVDAIYERAIMPDGGFTLQWEPRVSVACRTGDILRYLIMAGYSDTRISNGIEWILSRQRHDGGWLHCPLAGACDQLRLVLFRRSGNGLTREGDTSVTSCFYATIACALALCAYRAVDPSEAVDRAVGSAAEFFLRRSLFRSSQGTPIRPHDGNRDFRLLGYPVLSQYDILHGLLFIAHAGLIHDPRCGEAFNIVISKQNPDGTWNMESFATGMLEGDGSRRIRKSKWVTLKALRLLTIADSS